MFYDERIEMEKGKICQGILFLTVAFALPYWALHSLYVFSLPMVQLRFLQVALDGIITVTALILLTVGLLRIRGTDEREQFERYRWYSRVMPIYLAVIAVSTAILLPLQRHSSLYPQYAIYSVTEILEPLTF